MPAHCLSKLPDYRLVLSPGLSLCGRRCNCSSFLTQFLHSPFIHHRHSFPLSSSLSPASSLSSRSRVSAVREHCPCNAHTLSACTVRRAPRRTRCHRVFLGSRPTSPAVPLAAGDARTEDDPRCAVGVRCPRALALVAVACGIHWWQVSASTSNELSCLRYLSLCEYMPSFPIVVGVCNISSVMHHRQAAHRDPSPSRCLHARAV